MSRPCPPNKILNPGTNRCVKRDGRIGRELLRNKTPKTPTPKTPTPKTKNRRKPKCHILTSKDGLDLSKVIDFDTILLEDHERSGDRNFGVYIFFNNKINPLGTSPKLDDYGYLPEEVEVRKEDCGYSYFEDRLIAHNNLVPLQINNWRIIKYEIIFSEDGTIFSEDGIIFSEDAHHKKSAQIELEILRNDGAKASVSCKINFNLKTKNITDKKLKNLIIKNVKEYYKKSKVIYFDCIKPNKLSGNIAGEQNFDKIFELSI